MTNLIKEKLEKTISATINFSHDEKQKILHATKQLPSSKRTSIKLVFITAMALGIMCVLFIPIAQQQIHQLSLNKYFENGSIIPITIKDVDYPNLITSTYVSETNELIFTDGYQFFSYDVENNQRIALTAALKNPILYGFDANKNWLVWDKDKKGDGAFNILNRQTGEVTTLEGQEAMSLQLHDDLVTYMQSSQSDNSFLWDSVLNLETMESKLIHDALLGEGAKSKNAFNGDRLIIPSEVKIEGEPQIQFYEYLLSDLNNVRTYTFDYDTAHYVTITDNKIFALFEKDWNLTLGYIPLGETELKIIEAPDSSALAVYENYVALSVNKGDSNTVKLYQIVNDELKPMRVLDKFQERLVKPRFTKDGKLVVNGEGPNRTMYVIDVKKVN